MWRRIALVTVVSLTLAGCSFDGSGGATSTPVASAAKLRILRESFANPRSFRRAASVSEALNRLPIARVRPNAALASDESIDSVWISHADTWGEKSIVLIWKSGVVETISRWRCNCEAAPSLRQIGHHKPFRFLMLRGAPAMTAPSNPGQPTHLVIGAVAPAEAAYGRPASVETIRDGYNITLWQYGAHTQPGLIAAAETLPLGHIAFQVNGYDAGGAALRNWNGSRGIDVAPRGGARFGIGVALKNVTGGPLTITGVHALDGFIRLVGVHFHAYTPPRGSVVRLIAQAPYNATPERFDYQLRPDAWIGVQLDFQVRNPCIHWAQTIYDRTVEVAYTQGNHIVHLQEVPMVPLNITPRRDCHATR